MLKDRSFRPLPVRVDVGRGGFSRAKALPIPLQAVLLLVGAVLCPAVALSLLGSGAVCLVARQRVFAAFPKAKQVSCRARVERVSGGWAGFVMPTGC